MKFSVLLLIPDYAADNFGQDVDLNHVEADNAQQAVLVAQAFAFTHLGAGAAFDESEREDFHPLLVLHGWHDDVKP